MDAAIHGGGFDFGGIIIRDGDANTAVGGFGAKAGAVPAIAVQSDSHGAVRRRTSDIASEFVETDGTIRRIEPNISVDCLDADAAVVRTSVDVRRSREQTS